MHYYEFIYILVSFQLRLFSNFAGGKTFKYISLNIASPFLIFILSILFD